MAGRSGSAIQLLTAWSERGVAARLRTAFERLREMPLGFRVDTARELGLMQRWYASQPTQRVVTAVLELGAAVTREAIETALRELCVRHPYALGVCEERSPKHVSLRPLVAADVLPIEQSPRPGGEATSPEAEVWELAAAMVHRPFAPGIPLFRVALTSDRRYVVAAFDHLIADGVSVGIFAAELAALLAGRALAPLVAASEALPLDARLDLRPTLRSLSRAVVPGARGVVLTPRASQASIVRLQAFRTRILPLRVARADVDALLANARRRGVSLHAVLSSAALLSTLESLDTGRARLRLNTPISLRDRCQPAPRGLGVYIAGIDTDLEVMAEDDPWAVAQRCMHDIAKKRANSHRSVGLLAFAGDLHARAARYERTASGRTASVEVSNVGRVADVPGGTAIWLTQGAHYHAALFVLTIATSQSDGDLRCCMSYPEPLVEPAHAKRFMRAFERRLRQMLD